MRAWVVTSDIILALADMLIRSGADRTLCGQLITQAEQTRVNELLHVEALAHLQLEASR